MSKWLRGVPFNSSVSKIYHEKIDEEAAYNAFVQHWHHIGQIFDITKKNNKVSCDEVTAVINHFGKMVNLLLVDLNHLTETFHEAAEPDNKEHSKINGEKYDIITKPFGEAPPTPIYDYFMGERVLEVTLQWSLAAGEYVHTMQLELLKVYELILSHSHSEVIVFKPVTQPLLSLLHSCSGCVPVEVEKRLVVLLNHLWVTLLHNTKLLDYFFLPQELDSSKKFLVFSLLLQFTHREGSLGQQARDALLLCIAMCADSDSIAEYIACQSDFCPILAAAMSGYYSMLPRTLNYGDSNFYCLSPMDVISSSPLQMFMNCLEFCNAVVQTAHPVVSKQLVDFLFQGFLLPVVGPAISQKVTDELVTAIVYVELFLRTITEESLRRAFLALILLPQDFCEVPIISALISHLHSNNMLLTMVVMNLFETLISLHCEDAMVVLVFQYLTPCTHIMLSQISKLLQPSIFSSEHFLQLLPIVCQHEKSSDSDQQNSDKSIQSSKSMAYPYCSEYSSQEEKNSWNSVSSFYSYLSDAKCQVCKASYACSVWTWNYSGQSPNPHESSHLTCSCRTTSNKNNPVDSDDSCYRSLPCSDIKAVPALKKQRTRSLPSFTPLVKGDSSHFMEGKFLNDSAISKTFSKDDNFSQVLPKLFFPSESLFNNWLSLVYNEKVEPFLDSVDESSGYESFTWKGSRDFSPLKGTMTVRKSTKSLSDSLQEDSVSVIYQNNNGTDIQTDDDFLVFLERSPTPPFTTLQEDLNVIDEAYALISSHNLHLDSNEKVTAENEKAPSLRLSSSVSSLNEMKGDFKILDTIMHPQSKPTIGPFIEALLHLVENLLTLPTDAVILVMSCISKLASLPCALLTSLLLDPSVVLQPAVRSLYQVLGQLKQKIDCVLTADDAPLLMEARSRLNQYLSSESEGKHSLSANSSFVRGPKRRSFTQTVSAFLRRTAINERNSGRETLLQDLPDGSGYRYINLPLTSAQPFSAFSSASFEKQQAAICSVLLQDWLLELTAFAYEQLVNIHFIDFSSLKFREENF